MLMVEKNGCAHRKVAEWAELLPANAVVVVNNTRVRKARLLGQRAGSGGRVEILLLEPLQRSENGRGVSLWRALCRANRPLRAGSEVEAGALTIRVREQASDGTLSVELHSDEPVEDVLEREGHVPIPPYLGRGDDAEDAERYQTLFAERLGSVAAPTAGLHLSHAMTETLSRRKIPVVRLTLHIGIGTFRPVSTDDLDQHPMHAEHIEVTSDVCEELNRARRDNRHIVAVGTTVVRALESAADPEKLGQLKPYSGLTRLLVQPGYRFRVVDALLTNFHMPKSTLLALVAAFAGRERVLAAYQTAISQRYRLLSYGDAMWLPERLA